MTPREELDVHLHVALTTLSRVRRRMLAATMPGLRGDAAAEAVDRMWRCFHNFEVVGASDADMAAIRTAMAAAIERHREPFASTDRHATSNACRAIVADAIAALGHRPVRKIERGLYGRALRSAGVDC